MEGMLSAAFTPLSVRPNPSLNSGLKVLSLPVRRSFMQRRIEGLRAFSNIIFLEKVKEGTLAVAPNGSMSVNLLSCGFNMFFPHIDQLS